MKIALDFDETFTLDENFWEHFISMSKMSGHEVKFVTYRSDRWENSDILNASEKLGIDVIFTNGKQKANFYDADVWIDDSPVTIPRASDLGNMFDGCLVNDDMD